MNRSYERSALAFSPPFSCAALMPNKVFSTGQPLSFANTCAGKLPATGLALRFAFLQEGSHRIHDGIVGHWLGQPWGARERIFMGYV